MALKIIELQAENIKRLKVVRIVPKGNTMRNRPNQQKLVDAWNRDCPVGTRVRAFPAHALSGLRGGQDSRSRHRPKGAAMTFATADEAVVAKRLVPEGIT